MNDMKAASLTCSLLVRKGAAAPSAFAPPPLGGSRAARPASEPLSTVTPASAPVAAHLGAKQRANTGHAGASPKRDRTGRIRMSLRLHPVQHLRLKLVAALRRKSAQDLLISAMERYLDEPTPNRAGEASAGVAEIEKDPPYWPTSTRRSSFDLAG